VVWVVGVVAVAVWVWVWVWVAVAIANHQTIKGKGETNMTTPTLQDRCFDTVLERVQYMAQVAKTQVMKMTLNLAAERIAELELMNGAALATMRGCVNHLGADEYRRMDMTIKALEGSKP
jgi:hypothetical protein